MSSNLPEICDHERIVHPGTHFNTPRSGWYRIWYKTNTAPGWCCLRSVGSVAKLSYDRLVANGQVRNILIEEIDANTPAYRPGTYQERHTYTNRERKFLTERGIG